MSDVLFIKIMKSNLSNSENRAIESSISQNKVNNSNLYLDETDSKGVPLLRRVEKYPDLPENEFIPIEYTHSNGHTVKNIYYINKLGQIKNIETGKLLKSSKIRNYYSIHLFSDNKKRLDIRLHRLVASTFLINPDPIIYSVVNHIDHNSENNCLFNLEWTTQTINNSIVKGKRRYISKDKLMEYVALGDNKEELFTINRVNNKGYNIDQIVVSIYNKCKYKGYYWKRSRESKKEKALKLIGYSGNLDDYEWYEHWKYPGLYVCKEGFIKKIIRGNHRILCTMSREGYINIIIGKDHGKEYKAHRIIMEYILGRDLRNDEIIDHINTIKTDNSFSNLRVTNAKGNMNNPLTIEKRIKRVVAADLFGDFICYESGKYISKNILSLSSTVYSSSALVRLKTPGEKIIVIKPGNKEELLNKMKTVTYVFNNEMKVIGAFINIKLYKQKVETKVSWAIINKYLNSEKLAPDGNYYFRGDKAVELILSQGHGRAWEFEPENK
jgi:hypothetical protein